MKKFIGLILLASACPVVSVAQEAEPGGVYFTLDLNQRFETNTDRDLTTEEDEDGFESLSSFNFLAVTETRTQRLSFGLASGARAADGEVTAGDTSAALAYSRISADAALELSANWARADIAFLRDVTDFINDDGVLVLPDDIDDLTGTGFRTNTTLDAAIRWGESAPVGYSITYSQRFLRYQDANAALADADTIDVGAGLRLDVNPVATANIDLRYATTEEVGSPREDISELSTALTIERPRGNFTARLSAARDEDDETFWAASVDRVLTFPTGTLEATVGAAEDNLRDVQFTAQLAYAYALPRGQIDVSAGSNQAPGDDRRTLTLQAAFAHQISPISNMRIAFDFGEARNSDGVGDVSTGGLSASYGLSLTPVWELNVGARADVRESEGTRNRSNALFLSLDRTISGRP